MHRLLALDRKTGERIWKKKAGRGPGTLQIFKGEKSEEVLVNASWGYLYFHDLVRGKEVINFLDRTLLTRAQIEKKNLRFQGFWPIATCIQNGKLFAGIRYFLRELIYERTHFLKRKSILFGTGNT